MKRIINFIVALLIVASTITCVKASTYTEWLPAATLPKYEIVDTELRAVWVATVYNLDMKKQTDTTDAAITDWKNRYLKILDDLESNNMNAIIFQIRPCNDAFYPSKYNPWSEYLFKYGKDPGWDPLKWMIEVTHARGIEYHAWLNPYRATVSSSVSITKSTNGSFENIYDYDDEMIQKDKIKTFNALKDSCSKDYINPVFATDEKLKHNVVLGAENKYVLNPASQETTTHLINTIAEIVDNYDIDGIHFDDYFYPDDKAYINNGTNSDFRGMTFSTESLVDYADYQNYKNGGGSLNIYDWRRDNVNNLIKTLSDLIRLKNATKQIPCAFGISPSGRWAPSVEACPAGSPRGAVGGMNSQCNNYYSYSDLYADTKKWVDEQWIDYILPQAYTELTTGYTEIMSWWSDAMKSSPVKLYAGSPLYQLNKWGNYDEIYYQIRYNQAYNNRVDGYAMYDYSSMSSTNGKKGMSLISQTTWRKNALTPIYEGYNYKHDVSELINESKIEILADGTTYRVHYNEVSDAKAYALYKLTPKEFNETVVMGLKPNINNLIAINLKGHDYFDINNCNENDNYYLATISMDNTFYVNTNHIDFSKTIKNVAPEVKCNTTLNENYLVSRTISVDFLISDENNDPLTYKAYLVYRSKDSEIQTVECKDNVVTVHWTAFDVATPRVKIKLVVSDGKNSVYCQSSEFNIVDTCVVHNFDDATCIKAKTCKECGYTEGEPLGHDMSDATCTDAKICKKCGYTEGEPLGHDMVDADYENPRHCTRCDYKEGSPLEKEEPPTPDKPKKNCKKANVVLYVISILSFASTLIIFRKRK